MKRRLFSILLILCMVVTMLPVQVMAEDTVTGSAMTLEAGTYVGALDNVTRITSIAYYSIFSVRAIASGEGAPDFNKKVPPHEYNSFGYIAVYDSAGTLLEIGRYVDDGPDMRQLVADIDTVQLGCGTHTLTVKYFTDEKVSENAVPAAETTITITVTKATVTPSIVSYPIDVTFTGKPLPKPTIDQVDYALNDGMSIRSTDTELKEKLYAATQFLWENGSWIDAPTDIGTYWLKMHVDDTDVTTDSGLIHHPYSITINKVSSASTVAPMQTFLADTAKVYTIHLADYLEGLSVGENVKFSFIRGEEPWAKSGDNYTHSWYYSTTGKDGEGVTLSSDGILEISMSGNMGGERITESLFVKITSSNYESITMEIPFQWKRPRQEESMEVSMQGWTYGDTAAEPQFTQPEGTGTPVITYTTENGVYLSEKPVNAGKYIVTVRCEDDSKAYVGSAEFTIAPKVVTVTGITAISRAYNGTTEAALSYRDVKIVGAAEGSTLTVTATGTFDTKNVGTGKTVTLSDFRLSGEDAENYAVDPENSETEILGTITPRELTVQYDANMELGSKVYDGTTSGTVDAERHPFVEGYLDGEDLEYGTDYSAEFSYNDPLLGGRKPVTLRVTLLDTEKTKNYCFADGKRTFTGTGVARIFPQDMRLSLPYTDHTEKTYTLDLDNLPQGEWTYSTWIWMPDNMRSYVTANAEMQGNVLHYSVSGAMSGQSLLIEVTISSSVYGDVVQRIYIDLVYRNTNPDFRFESSELTKVYGDEDFTVAAIGAAEGSSVTYRSGDETVATVDSSGKVHIVGAGSTRITAISAETADYQETEASYMLRVERRQVEIPDADTTVFVYNGMEQTYRLAAGEDYTITGSLTQTNANEAGYPIIVSLKDKANTKWADSEDDTADKTYRFVIRKADAAVTAMGRNAHVGDTVPALPTQPVKGTDYIVSGLFGDDILTGTVLLDYADTPDMSKPGETAIRITGTLAGENYNVTYVPGKLIVTHSAASCDHVWDSGKVTTPATCTEKGVKTYTCTKDSSHTKTEEIPAQGHDPVQHEAKAPTCTENGWDAYETCSRCDYTTYKEKAAQGHDLVQHEAKAPTCTENGWDAYETCSRCDYTTYKEKAALGHDLEYHPAKAATTAAEGNTEYWYCKACGKYFSGKEGAKEISQADTVIARLKEDPKSPQTGDTSNLALWFALLLMSSAAAIGATVAVGKKRTIEN